MMKVAMILALLAGLTACGRDRNSNDQTPYVRTMIRMLEDEDYTVRRCAARALGRLGPIAAQAVPALECALGDEEPTVREAAEIALSRILPKSQLAMARSDR